jgi:hypothetical protein
MEDPVWRWGDSRCVLVRPDGSVISSSGPRRSVAFRLAFYVGALDDSRGLAFGNSTTVAPHVKRLSTRARELGLTPASASPREGQPAS